MAIRYVRLKGEKTNKTVMLPVRDFDAVPTRDYGEYPAYHIYCLRESSPEVSDYNAINIFRAYALQNNVAFTTDTNGQRTYSEKFRPCDAQGTVYSDSRVSIELTIKNLETPIAYPSDLLYWEYVKVGTKSLSGVGAYSGHVLYMGENGAWVDTTPTVTGYTSYYCKPEQGTTLPLITREPPRMGKDVTWAIYLKFNTANYNFTSYLAQNSVATQSWADNNTPFAPLSGLTYRNNKGQSSNVASSTIKPWFACRALEFGMAKYKRGNDIEYGPCYAAKSPGGPFMWRVPGEPEALNFDKDFYTTAIGTGAAIVDFFNTVFASSQYYEEVQSSGGGGGTSTEDGGGGAIGETGTGGNVTGDISVGTYPGTEAPQPTGSDTWSSILGTKFITAYRVNASDLDALAERLWSDTFIDKIKNKFQNIQYNTLDHIVSLRKFPFIIPTARSQVVSVMGTNTEYSLPLIENQCITIDMGVVRVPEYFASFLDYHSNVSMYIPFVGLVNMSPADIIGSFVSLRYVCDILSGQALARVTVSRPAKGTVAEVKDIELYNYPCQMAQDIPLSSNAGSSNALAGSVAVAGGVGTALAGLATLNPALAASGAIGAATGVTSLQNDSVSRSGNITGNTGYLGKLSASIIIARPIQVKPVNYESTIGYPSDIGGKVGDFKGYTVIKSWNPSISGLTSEELDMLDEIVKGGFII